MAMYGDLQLWVAVLVNAALIAYLALFPALFAVVMRRLVAAHGAPALMAAPLVWVATELGRTYLLTGFPWVLLGYSQATVLPIAQLASIFGVYGVSALVAGVSAAAAVVAVVARQRRHARIRAIGVRRDSVSSLRCRLGQPARVGRGVDARGRADPRRADPGQRRSGGEVGTSSARARSSTTTCG